MSLRSSINGGNLSVFPLLFVLITATLFCPAKVVASTFSPDELLKRGMELVREGNYQAGTKRLEAAWMMRPKNIRYMYQLGLAYYNFGLEEGEIEFIERAQALWKQAANSIPDEGDDMMRTTLLDIVSRAEIRKEKVAERIALERILSESPNALEEGLVYAKILRKKGRYDEAAELYQRLADEHSMDPRAYTEMARLVYGMGRILWAESYYNQALMRNPSYEPARDGMKELYESLEPLRIEGYQSLVESSH